MSGLFSKKHFGSIFTLFFCRSIHYLRAHPQTYLNTVNGLYRTGVNYLMLISAPQWLRGWWGGATREKSSRTSVHSLCVLSPPAPFGVGRGALPARGTLCVGDTRCPQGTSQP